MSVDKYVWCCTRARVYAANHSVSLTGVRAADPNPNHISILTPRPQLNPNVTKRSAIAQCSVVQTSVHHYATSF